MDVLGNLQYRLCRASLRAVGISASAPLLALLGLRSSGGWGPWTGSDNKLTSGQHPSKSVHVRAGRQACLASMITSSSRAKPGGAFELANNRIECAVRVMRRAEMAQPRMRFAGESASSAAVSRDLPMPGSPETALLVLRRPWPNQRRINNSNSSSRPTRVVRSLACSASKRLSTGLGRSAAHARAGPAMPLRSFAPRSRSSNRLPRSLRVPSAMTTMSGSAIACSRAARFGCRRRRRAPAPPPIRSGRRQRPARSRSRPARATAPAAVTSFGAASTIASPACTARSASCSWACG